ncbi:hypothetical protein ACNUDN_29090 [Mycobacterium sp. smrl_JER01]|uniref:hypothetical protein n=1 Tax=unclassified Mycobacterium TaxID=2642494 RepID=UPI0002EE3CCA|nr:hypothetical protein [Mycobacterium sp. shizuoka-1]GAY16109.1 hypothetical protein MSZK_28350 [Mycobacterium sp. shizuoka-1]
MSFHPAVESFLAKSRELGSVLGKVQSAMYDDLRVRRAAPEEPNVMPEIDGYGALTDLYLDGIVGRYSARQIEDLVMSGLQECYAAIDERRLEAVREAVPEFDQLDLGLG